MTIRVKTGRVGAWYEDQAGKKFISTSNNDFGYFCDAKTKSANGVTHKFFVRFEDAEVVKK